VGVYKVPEDSNTYLNMRLDTVVSAFTEEKRLSILLFTDEKRVKYKTVKCFIIRRTKKTGEWGLSMHNFWREFIKPWVTFEARFD
jgi:hypothetical protein